MARKDSKETKDKIVNAAWELFNENGFDNTTVDDIVARSKTSKGSFYHYFDSKEDLLFSIPYIYDQMYYKLLPELDNLKTSCEKILYLNREQFKQIENRIPVELHAKTLGSLVAGGGTKYVAVYESTQFHRLRQIINEGYLNGEFRPDVSVNEIAKAIMIMERAIAYDWCLHNGTYSLYQYSHTMMSMLLKSFLSNPDM